MKNFYAAFLFSFLCMGLSAQKQANMWYFGENAGLDFNSGTPVAFTGSAMSTNEGCSSIADLNGNTLFYTDGTSVWDKNNHLMPHGTGLSGNATATQSGLIVQQPGSANRYYIFTTFSTLNYSVVDMNLNGGLGDVITPDNTLLISANEKMCATRHANGTDVWILSKPSNSTAFNAFLLTSSGVSLAPVISNNGISPTADYGQMKVSPQGDRIAIGMYDGSDQTIQVSDFDNSTGIVSNSYTITTAYDQTYGLEFSKSGKILYATSNPYIYGVYQFNLNAGSPAAVQASSLMIGSTLSYDATGMQLGPDGKIYIAPDGSGYLDAIPNPEILGAGCGYTQNAVYLGGNLSQLGLPEFVSNILDSLYLQANINYSNITCDSFCDARATIVASYGIPPYHYLWMPGNDTGSTVSNLCAGFYTVIVTDSANVHTYTDTFSIIQRRQVFANSSTTPEICGATDGTATAIGWGGDSLFTFVWSNGDTGVTVRELVSGSYTVTVLDNVGCSASAVAVVGSASPDSVTISAPLTHFCSNDSTQICASIGFRHYEWNTGDTSGCIRTSLGGNYYVTITDINNCTAVSNRLAIVVFPPISISISVTGDTLAVFNPGDTYQWFLNDTAIPGATGAVYKAMQVGSYSVQITDTNGCNAISTAVIVSKVTTGIGYLDDDENISIYPNPLSGGVWQIKVADKLIGAALEIFDAGGRVVYHSKIESSAYQIAFDAAKGVYLLHISSPDGVVVKKLVRL